MQPKNNKVDPSLEIYADVPLSEDDDATLRTIKEASRLAFDKMHEKWAGSGLDWSQVEYMQRAGMLFTQVCTEERERALALARKKLANKGRQP